MSTGTAHVHMYFHNPCEQTCMLHTCLHKHSHTYTNSTDTCRHTYADANSQIQDVGAAFRWDVAPAVRGLEEKQIPFQPYGGHVTEAVTTSPIKAHQGARIETPRVGTKKQKRHNSY